MFEFIREQLQNNNFLSGGAILMILGGVAAACRRLPGRVWDRIKSYCITEVDIPDRDQSFLWVAKWLAVQPYGQRTRLLTVRTEHEDARPPHACDDTNSGQPKIILSPAPGYHWFFYRGRPVMLHRERSDAGNPTAAAALSFRETFNIKVFSRDRTLVMQMLEEAREIVHPKGEKRVGILTARYGNWGTTMKRRPRPIDSVVLADGLMEDLIDAIQKFLTSEQWYIERGIPYRLGVLLSGPPGSGKSSAVIALASHFSMDIAILNLNGGMDDDELRNLLADVPPNTVVLIEDIDCVYEQRKSSEDKDNKVTFSGLLNAIDGVAAGEGRILFLTTNHPDKLDPALVRPGRCDIRKTIDYPEYTQILRLWDRFYPEALALQSHEFAKAIPPQTSMAALQGHFLKHNNPDDAFNNLENLNANDPSPVTNGTAGDSRPAPCHGLGRAEPYPEAA